MAVAWTAARACTVSIDQNCDETRIRLNPTSSSTLKSCHELQTAVLVCRWCPQTADAICRRRVLTSLQLLWSPRLWSASGWSDRCFQVRLWSGVSFSPSVDHKLGHSERWRLICRLSPTPSLKGQSAQNNNNSRLEPQVQPDQLGLTHGQQHCSPINNNKQ